MIFSEGRNESIPQSETKEIPKIMKDFQGPDAEVTMPRTSGKMDSGWVVSKPDGREGWLLAVNEEQNIEKSIKAEALLRAQPFQVGEKVSVVNPESGKFEEGWVVSNRNGDGFYDLENGDKNQMTAAKAGLIEGKIIELQKKRGSITDWNDIVPDDRRILQKIDDELEYWQAKLNKVRSLEK